MQSRIDEIARDTYRISWLDAEFGIQFNQFLVAAEEPFLMHTGFRRVFPATLAAVEKVIDPARLRWVGFSHFEADESGALNEWLAVAPNAQPVCSVVGALVNLADQADRPPRALADGEVLELGGHSLRFLATPHVPHGWDAGLFLDEAERTLFCSDLFFQPGDLPPLVETDIVGPAAEAIAASQAGPLANDLPYTARTGETLERLARLEPRLLATMHGSSFAGDAARALRELDGVLRAAL